MRFDPRKAAGRLHAGLVALVVLLSLVLTAGQARDTLTLYDAIRDDRLSTSLQADNASSGDVMFVDMAKRPGASPGDIHVRVPPGTVLRNGNGAGQSMVVAGVAGLWLGGGQISPASEIVVSSTTPVRYVLEAYCAQFEKDNPSPSDRFTVEAPDPTLAAILTQSANLSLEAKQAAIWLQTDHVTFAHMNQKFPIGQADWTAAQAVFQGAPVSQSPTTRASTQSPQAGSSGGRGNLDTAFPPGLRPVPGAVTVVFPGQQSVLKVAFNTAPIEEQMPARSNFLLQNNQGNTLSVAIGRDDGFPLVQQFSLPKLNSRYETSLDPGVYTVVAKGDRIGQVQFKIEAKALWRAVYYVMLVPRDLSAFRVR